MPWYDLEETHEYKNIGLPMELLAQHIIKTAMKVDIVAMCNNSDYDFIDSNGVTYEIKADTKSHKTGNFFIEYGQMTLANTEFQPSGISKSKADYYMIQYGESLYKIKTGVIRYLITKPRNHYHAMNFTNDRREQVKGLLLSVDDIKPYAVIYNFNEYPM